MFPLRTKDQTVCYLHAGASSHPFHHFSRPNLTYLPREIFGQPPADHGPWHDHTRTWNNEWRWSHQVSLAIFVPSKSEQSTELGNIALAMMLLVLEHPMNPRPCRDNKEAALVGAGAAPAIIVAGKQVWVPDMSPTPSTSCSLLGHSLAVHSSICKQGETIYQGRSVVHIQIVHIDPWLYSESYNIASVSTVPTGAGYPFIFIWHAHMLYF